jgi:hypothetical protein
MQAGDLVRISGYGAIPVVGIRRDQGSIIAQGVNLHRGTVAVVVDVDPADLHGRQDIGLLIDGEVLWVAAGFLQTVQFTLTQQEET